MTARELILFADKKAREKGWTQAQWSHEAGFDQYGKAISRTVNRGNCKLTTLIRMLKALGYELSITEGAREDTAGNLD